MVNVIGAVQSADRRKLECRNGGGAQQYPKTRGSSAEGTNLVYTMARGPRRREGWGSERGRFFGNGRFWGVVIS